MKINGYVGKEFRKPNPKNDQLATNSTPTDLIKKKNLVNSMFSCKPDVHFRYNNKDSIKERCRFFTMKDIGLVTSHIHLGNYNPIFKCFDSICKQRQYTEQDLRI